MAPVFCGEVKVTQDPQDCLAEAKVTRMRVPYAQDQNTVYLEGLKGKKLMMVIPAEECSSVHRNTNLKGAFGGYCNDNTDGQTHKIDIILIGKGTVQIERHGAKEILNCDKAK